MSIGSKFISREYADLNRALHEANDDYGGGRFADAPGSVKVCRLLNARELLDYGCGKGQLRQQILSLAPDIAVHEYDPAVPGKSTPPTRGFPLVVCFDVLEHVEPEKLSDVVAHIAELTEIAAYIGVHNGPAQKVLSDGRNAHLIQHPPDWWQSLLTEKHFTLKKGTLFAEPSAPTTPVHSLFLLEKRR